MLPTNPLEAFLASNCRDAGITTDRVCTVGEQVLERSGWAQPNNAPFGIRKRFDCEVGRAIFVSFKDTGYRLRIMHTGFERCVVVVVYPDNQRFLQASLVDQSIKYFLFGPLAKTLRVAGFLLVSREFFVGWTVSLSFARGSILIVGSATDTSDCPLFQRLSSSLCPNLQQIAGLPPASNRNKMDILPKILVRITPTPHLIKCRR